MDPQQPTEPVAGQQPASVPEQPPAPAPEQPAPAVSPPPGAAPQAQPMAAPPPPQPTAAPPPRQPAAPMPPAASWQTPEPDAGPAPGVRFAPHGPRLVAYIVDVIIIGIVITVLTVVFTAILVGAATSDNAGAAIGSAFLLVFFVLLISLAYFPWFWARGGQTPGLRMFHLRVVRDADGGPVSGGQAVMRLIGYWIDSIVFYIGFAWILVDKRRRGWHDLLAGTCVIEV
jgi:uncharacterized RDD family membrane protein YckC